MPTKIISTIGLLFLALASHAQPLNDECRFATFISDIDDYCSEPMEFTNVDATSDPMDSDLCFLSYTNGVWFSFVPREPAINVRIFGRGISGNTLGSPQMALYSDCGDYVTCSPGRTNGTDELVISDLLIGQVYYLMVEGAPGAEGTFQLCIDDFKAPPSPQSDCDKAITLCDKSPFTVNALTSVGDDATEGLNSCIGGERASSWYQWECELSGTLTMELIPSNLGIVETVDDLDFIIYELPNGFGDCDNKVPVRCMGSGANVTNGVIDPVSTWPLCNRATGMRDSETDVEETGGCQGNSNNYIAPLDMVAGRSYAMLINNFSTSGLGFSIEFGGTGTFRGPVPSIDVAAVQAFECDKTIIFSQNSTSPDSIIGYTWNFGAGSSPNFSNDPNPNNVVYESFGDKTAALTIESERGCTVTEIIDFFVEPCCEDFEAIEASAELQDLLCNGIATGQIFSNAIGGTPDYEYSLDGINFQPNPRFPELAAGDYLLFVRDIKGCVDSINVNLTEPPPLIVQAGPDVTIDLGTSTTFNASYSPPDADVMIEWSNPETIEGCEDCLTPTVTPTNNGEYMITVTDENGCTSVSSLRVNVEFTPEIMAPNVFSPDGQFDNNFFNLFGGPAIEIIEELQVYDRWGNLVYDGKDLEISNRTIGWDGTYNGELAEIGVYVWRGRVRFINNESIDFHGDITLLR